MSLILEANVREFVKWAALRSGSRRSGLDGHFRSNRGGCREGSLPVRWQPGPSLVFRARAERLTRRTVDVATYLAALERSKSPSTIRRRLAAISVSHQLAGLDTPTADVGVKSVWRVFGVAMVSHLARFGPRVRR
jgi:hypothetical protein